MLSVGNSDQWTANTGTKVDAVNANDDATAYISETTDEQEQLFVIDASGVPSGATINSITPKGRAVRGSPIGSPAMIRFVLRFSGSQDYDSSDTSLTTSWADYAGTTRSVHPGDAFPFVYSDLTTVEVGVILKDPGSDSHGALVTYLYAEIDYTAPAGGSGGSYGCSV